MVRLTLLIVSLLGVFLLNACGGSNFQEPKYNNKDALEHKKGSFYGKAETVMIPEFNEKDEVVYKEPNKVFNDVDIAVDWDKKTVRIQAKVINKKKGSNNKPEDVVYEGQFNEEGIAYLKPKDSKLKSIAGVRCTDGCTKVVADIGVKHEVDGALKYEEQQFTVKDPNAEENTIKEDQNTLEEITNEIDPVGSNLVGPQNNNTERKLEKKPDFSNVVGSVVTTAISKDKSQKTKTVKTPTSKQAEKTKGVVAEAEPVEIDMDEPGVPSTLPSVIREGMMDSQEPEITLGQYSTSALFPYDLGAKYTGKALGFYSSRGSLIKGVDVAMDADEETGKNIGFHSIRNDKNYYGSGLLVKMIEEAGKKYAEISNGDFFEVNDLSKKGGGYVRPHSSHQNGLDADILLPHKGKSFDYGKVWKILKIFDSYGFIDVILLSQPRINSLCSYLKHSGEKDYQSLFHKLYKESGHTSHFHLRLQCTNHNIGCISATYTESKRGVCR